MQQHASTGVNLEKGMHYQADLKKNKSQEGIVSVGF
jgi:hypothetical protein